MNKKTVGLYFIATAIVIALLSAGGLAALGTLEQQIIEREQRDIRSLAVAAGEKFATIASVMEVTGDLPQFADTLHVAEMSPELHGVPEDVEVEKRQVGKSILLHNPDIEAVAYILPDGEMYVEEPFFRQMNLTRTNFAFRDYFQGAVSNQAAYLGEVYISASSGVSSSAVAVPITSDGELKGVWIGLLHLESLDRFAKDMFEGDDDRRFVFADQHGHEVVYSNELVFSLEGVQTLVDFGPYRKALAGESGWSVETINGTEMLVAYHPVQAPATTWAVFSIQNYDEVTSPVNEMRINLYGAIAIASAIGVGLGVVIARKT